MELLKMEKVGNGRFLKNYELTYLNKAGREKKYEMVSRRELSSPDDLGKSPSHHHGVPYRLLPACGRYLFIITKGVTVRHEP